MKYFAKIIFPLLCGILLFFSCSSNKPITEAIPSPTPSLDMSKWKLLSVKGKTPKYDDSENRITLIFNAEAKTIGGYTSCNRYFGNFIDKGNGEIKLSDIGSSKRACPTTTMELEKTYLQSLAKVNNYLIVNGELQLLINERVIFVFEKDSKSEN